jgi:phosphoglycerate dehydrogenase-like enzyme
MLRAKDLLSGVRPKPIRLDDFEDYVGTSYSQAGTPSVYFMLAGVLNFWPIPSAATTIRALYLQFSARLTDTSVEADFLIPLAVATAETENLVDGALLARLKPGALLVNASRGNLMDEAAVAAALDSGRLGGLAMDVGRAADQKPSLVLARRPGVLASPHIGGLTPEAIAYQAMETVRQAAEIVRGVAPPGAVNADAAHRLPRLGNRAP